MKQFKPWKNNLEKDTTKIPEEKLIITRVEYKTTDRVEKSVATQAFKINRQVTKEYLER